MNTKLKNHFNHNFEVNFGKISKKNSVFKMFSLVLQFSILFCMYNPGLTRNYFQFFYNLDLNLIKIYFCKFCKFTKLLILVNSEADAVEVHMAYPCFFPNYL